MPFCKLCGKNLNEGENCTCNTEEKEQGIKGSSSNVSVVSETVQKSIPFVGDVFYLIRRTISKNTVKEVSKSAKQNSILWVFVLILECVINALALTVVIRRGLYTVANNLYKSFISSGMSYSDFSKSFKELGLGFFNLFSRTFLIGIVSFFIAVGLIYILLKICKKTFMFNNIANMVSTAAIPLSFFSIINIILSFIIPQATILIYFIAIISVSLLMYFGIQKIDKFTESPFWIYMTFMFVLLISYYLIIKILMSGVSLDGVFSSIF